MEEKTVQAVRSNRYFTTEQAGDYLGVSTMTIYRWIHDRSTGFPFIKVGSIVRIDPKALDLWMAKNMVNPPK